MFVLLILFRIIYKRGHENIATTMEIIFLLRLISIQRIDGTLLICVVPEKIKLL